MKTEIRRLLDASSGESCLALVEGLLCGDIPE